MVEAARFPRGFGSTKLACDCFVSRSISYLALSDRRTRTCIFRQLRHNNTDYTRTAVLLHK
ncbi:hypothetical protein [Klebsiella phage vB_KpnS-VAC51]|uniref:Uncharacterized protein n=1 Tax=Klebsiella phage vB_KpnS-VAC51 TaxID=2866698 RepID=A0AAE9C5Y9_9CAUD|nr:hypothetical protein [Klebsiella phage vB_KpnS-VAC51]